MENKRVATTKWLDKYLFKKSFKGKLRIKEQRKVYRLFPERQLDRHDNNDDGDDNNHRCLSSFIIKRILLSKKIY